jgi:hypothetical protein
VRAAAGDVFSHQRDGVLKVVLHPEGLVRGIPQAGPQ